MKAEAGGNKHSNIELLQWRPSNVKALQNVFPEGSGLAQGIPHMDRAMYSFSNTELKPAIMLYGLDETPVSSQTVVGRLSEILPDSWGRQQAINYGRMIQGFIIPPGFVEETPSNYYSTTHDGEGFAKDTAAFLLAKAVDLATPFGPIISESDRTDEGEEPTRAYITRIASLLALRNGPMSQVELLNLMGKELPSLKWNLGVLASKGFLLYDSISPEVKGEFVYKRSNNNEAPIGLSPTAQNIINYFKTNELGNNYAISKALGGKSLQYVGKILRQLADTGVVEAVKWEQDLQSEAKLTELGERFVDEVITPLLLSYSGDEDSQKLLKDVRSTVEDTPIIAMNALDQYKTQRVLTPEIVTQRTIVDMVRGRGPLRRREIIAEIGYKAHPQLRDLIANGELKIVRDGNASFYVLPESKEQPEKAEEMVIFSFNPPKDLVDSIQFRKRDEYRQYLDKPEFWDSLIKSLEKIKADRYTARDFFLKYDPEHKDWPKRWDSGTFSGHIRALRSLEVETPWEFIRTYKPESGSPELQSVIAETQRLLDEKVPVESTERAFNRRYLDPLEYPEFWHDLAVDISNVPQGTKFESFLLRFDPNAEGGMKPGHTYGKYYPFLCSIRDHLNNRADAFLTGYRPPEGTPPETLLIIRKTQEALRSHLRLKNIPDDDFSDIPGIQNQLAEEEQKKKVELERYHKLRKQFERFSHFNKDEIEGLERCDMTRIQDLQHRIKGDDFEDASFARMGLQNVKREGNREAYIPFPAELRAAFLIYLFEFWRRGEALPTIPEEYEDFILSNGVVRSSFRTTEQYLNHYEKLLRKQDPHIKLTLDKLLGYVISYVKRSEIR